MNSLESYASPPGTKERALGMSLDFTICCYVLCLSGGTNAKFQSCGGSSVGYQIISQLRICRSYKRLSRLFFSCLLAVKLVR